MSIDVNSIEWDAPILPGVSMAAIPLHAACDDLDAVVAAYLIDADARLYRFERGPDLRKGMVLTSMEMAGFCSPCLGVIALVIWLRSLLRSGAGLCGRSRLMHWECRGMSLHVSPIVDLQ